MSDHPAPNPSSKCLFGPFALDTLSGELTKHGIRVRLQGQPLHILLSLVRQHGHVVPREELQQQLWGDSTFVDFEHGLNTAMNRLRQALNDSAEYPRYIETVPGRGYRFIVSVQESSTRPVLVMPPAPAAPIEPARTPQLEPRRISRSVWFVVAISIAVLSAVAVVGLRTPAAPSPPLQFSIYPPDGFAFEAGSSRQTFALSPDGRQLAFTALDSTGIFQTFVRALHSPEARPLANSSGSYTVFWAPDGRSLFMTMRGSLRRTVPGADSYQVVCDAPPFLYTAAIVPPNLLLSSLAGSYWVPVSGGAPQRVAPEALSSVAPQRTDQPYAWPQVLPGGRRLLYTAFDPKSRRYRAHVVELGRPDTDRDLLETDSRTIYAPSVLRPGTGYLFYIRAGNILAAPFDPQSLQLQGEPVAVVSRTYWFYPTGGADFSVSENGMLAYRRYLSRSQLAWVNRAGEVVKKIGPPNVNVKQGRLSPDGRKIAASIFDVSRGVNDLWIVDTETGASRRAITGRELVDNPVWAPDSKRLVFSRAMESLSLFVRGDGEMDEEEALQPGFFQIPTDWSRDGRFLAFSNTAFVQVQNELRGDVWLIDRARGNKTIHLISTPYHEAAPAFSPDGHWLAFASDESGRSELYLQSFESGDSPRLAGERHLVSRHGAGAIRWRPDGKELYYLGSDGRVYAVPIKLSPKLQIGEPSALFEIGLEARAALHSFMGFDVSHDGQRFLVPIVTSPERSEIVVIQNWEAMLRRQTGGVN
jgi:Tol biopolymer transport system component/DNA-binding winged helix-turn-helix (wHTH) protein